MSFNFSSLISLLEIIKSELIETAYDKNKAPVCNMKLGSLKTILLVDKEIEDVQISDLKVHWSDKNSPDVTTYDILARNSNPNTVLKAGITELFDRKIDPGQNKEVRAYLTNVKKDQIDALRKAAMGKMEKDKWSSHYDNLPTHIWYQIYQFIKATPNDFFDLTRKNRIDAIFDFNSKMAPFWNIKELLQKAYDDMINKYGNITMYLTFKDDDVEQKSVIMEFTKTTNVFTMLNNALDFIYVPVCKPPTSTKPTTPTKPSRTTRIKPRKRSMKPEEKKSVNWGVVIARFVILMLIVYMICRCIRRKKENNNPQVVTP
ncbi:hypothetical protein ECANGB1_1180 [Enterospora canceri]|uniref:Uncharacterized protein n=1 Tax=Enterospora canceri TaxID=1081671 RepID=A0A1Y1S7E1_9MICR|nr:hypothetical protein ECANGB1_1180 [Enterospora canceri]